MKGRALAACLLALVGCGYFNKMYNAERRFAEAERAAARGERLQAQNAWRDAIDKAASKLRDEPTGRWADDALLVIGRAHFGLGQYDQAAAALERAVDAAGEPAVRTEALVWLGAAEASRGRPEPATVALDSALASLDESAGLAARARLWRARAAVASGRTTDAWSDLDAVARSGGATATQARLDMAGLALTTADTARFHAAARAILSSDAATSADSLASLLRVASTRWSPAFARFVLDPVDRIRVPSDVRDRLRLERARHAAASGDRVGAIADARAASRGRGETADRARVLAARWILADAAGVADLAAARDLLLAALADLEGRSLLRHIDATGVLLERAAEGQPLALFAAAELARDQLNAVTFARQLFLTYAELAPGSVWAPKALLAATTLGAETKTRLAAHDGANVYLAALHGDADGAAFADAEARLASALAGLRSAALSAADSRDRGVARALADIDSVRLAARTDSVRLACGLLLDSLGVAGLRSDSARAACTRGDSTRLAEVLRMDTLMLLDSAARADTLRRPRGRVRLDTTATGRS